MNAKKKNRKKEPNLMNLEMYADALYKTAWLESYTEWFSCIWDIPQYMFASQKDTVATDGLFNWLSIFMSFTCSYSLSSSLWLLCFRTTNLQCRCWNLTRMCLEQHLSQGNHVFCTISTFQCHKICHSTSRTLSLKLFIKQISILALFIVVLAQVWEQGCKEFVLYISVN